MRYILDGRERTKMTSTRQSLVYTTDENEMKSPRTTCLSCTVSQSAFGDRGLSGRGIYTTSSAIRDPTSSFFLSPTLLSETTTNSTRHPLYIVYHIPTPSNPPYPQSTGQTPNTKTTGGRTTTPRRKRRRRRRHRTVQKTCPCPNCRCQMKVPEDGGVCGKC